MKHILESLASRVRKIRNNPDMLPTHAALAIREITDCLEQLNDRVTAIEAKQAAHEHQRIDWQLGAMVPSAPAQPTRIHLDLSPEDRRQLANEIQAHFINGALSGEPVKRIFPPSEAGSTR